MIFTEGSGSVRNNNGSGRPKNIRIRIHNTAFEDWCKCGADPEQCFNELYYICFRPWTNEEHMLKLHVITCLASCLTNADVEKRHNFWQANMLAFCISKKEEAKNESRTKWKYLYLSTTITNVLFTKKKSAWKRIFHKFSMKKQQSKSFETKFTQMKCSTKVQLSYNRCAQNWTTYI